MFTLDSLFGWLGGLLMVAVLMATLAPLAGIALAVGLRMQGLRWTWSVALLPLVLLLSAWSAALGLAGACACLVGCVAGMAWHSRDMMAGGDHAQIAGARLGVLELLRRLADGWQADRHGRGWVRNGYLEVGREGWGRTVSIPAGATSGSHTLIVGATGSGKTCGQAWIAARLIEHGHAAIAIDPKGDRLLETELQGAAEHTGAAFLRWTPEGPIAYDPYARGTDTEIADKALAGETFTEPHYLRQAQRYLGYVVRVMRAAQIPVTAASLMEHMKPDQLEQTARSLPDEQADTVHDYLDSLGERQRRELGGVRDRLSILAESDVAPWLDPLAPAGAIDLKAAIESGAVVYFSLQSDRRPLLARMLAGAIVADLVTLTADLQEDPIPTLVLIDEFSAIAPEQVARLFGRARSAGISLLLATQEFADLEAAGQRPLRDQALGNLDSTIAYRQNVPASAELVANIAGTAPAWITTQQTTSHLFMHGGLSGRGTRRRGHEYTIHPSQIKQLRTGEAVIITPATGAPPTIAQIHHPDAAHDARTPVRSAHAQVSLQAWSG